MQGGQDLEGEGRLPPHSLEAERSVLGAILISNESLDRVREVGLDARDFYKDAHQKIFEVASFLQERRDTVDLVTLTAALKDRGWYDSTGGSQTLVSLLDDSFAVGNVVNYARIVRDKAIVRRMIEACVGIMQSGFSGVTDTDAFLEESEQSIFSVADIKLENTMAALKSILLKNMATIEDVAMRKEDVTGLATGFTKFDQMTTGLHPGQIVIIAGRPGMGKTSWFISALQHAALHKGGVVALFSLEMSKEEIGFKFLSGLARIDSKKLKVGRLQDRDWQKLAQAADQLSKSKIFVDDQGGLTVLDIRARCRRLMSVEKRLDLVVVDYLQLMKGTKGSRGGGDFSREREISEISRNLKELSKEMRVPIIALSQLNRAVEQRQDKRPTLADLRESGAIEQDADLVCFIHRDDYYKKDSEHAGRAELIIAKNRSGETGMVELAWLPQYTLFANLASDHDGAQIMPPRPDRGDITL